MYHRSADCLLRVDLARPDPRHLRSKFILAAENHADAAEFWAAIVRAASAPAPAILQSDAGAGPPRSSVTQDVLHSGTESAARDPNGVDGGKIPASVWATQVMVTSQL
eukprot:SAG31_NODE_12580_length_931_cov_1.120192_2_plen_107_part_01